MIEDHNAIMERDMNVLRAFLSENDVGDARQYCAEPVFFANAHSAKSGGGV